MNKKIEEIINKILNDMCVENPSLGIDVGARMLVIPRVSKKINTEVQKAVNNLIKKIEGMAFDKEASDITQEYQSIFLDGYNQAIEEVVEYLQSLDKGETK